MGGMGSKRRGEKETEQGKGERKEEREEEGEASKKYRNGGSRCIEKIQYKKQR